MPGINILSLFDGISCGRLASDRAGYKTSNYYASEVDKYAIQVSNNNYPEIIRLGDVTRWREWAIDWSSIDLLIGGSPCQGFSFSGKQLAFDDPRSKLFFEYVVILNHIRKFNPNIKFLFENVKMKKEFIQVINNHLEVEPVLINSSLVSAQNRERLYWANWHITQPNDKGIYLKDIIESGYVDREKSFCIDANYAKGSNLNNYFNKSRRQIVLLDNKSTIRIGTANDIKGHDYNKRIYSIFGKAPCLVASSGGNHKPKIAINDFNYRKLTPLECERLQTLPDGYTSGISSSQRYKCLGNGWTVDVIAHLFTCLKDQKQPFFNSYEVQLRLAI